MFTVFDLLSVCAVLIYGALFVYRLPRLDRELFAVKVRREVHRLH